MAQGEIVITAGNHDHALIEPWLIARGQELAPPPLGPEQLLEPADRLARARADRRVVRPGEGHRRLSRPVGARGRVRHPRPLPRLPPHDPHARAPHDGRHGAGPRQTPLEPAQRRRLRVDLRADVRVARRCRPRRAHRGRPQRHRHGQRLAGAPGGEAHGRRLTGREERPGRLRRAYPRQRPQAAHARAGGGVPAGGGGAQPGRARTTAQQHLRRRAAPGGPGSDGTGRRPPRPRAVLRRLRTHPPHRSAGRRTGRASGAPPAAPACSTPAAGSTCRCSSATPPPRTPTGPAAAWSSTTRAPRRSGACCRASPAPRSHHPAGARARAGAPPSPRRRRRASRCCRPSPAGSGG